LQTSAPSYMDKARLGRVLDLEDVNLPPSK
jgi:hypothetical protein